jgi:hypothetical protein
MIKCILLERTGNIIPIEISNSNIEDNHFDNVFKNSMLDVKELVNYTFNENEELKYKIYGCDNEHLLKENKHELPFPHDTTIFHGDLLLIKYHDKKLIDVHIDDDVFF